MRIFAATLICLTLIGCGTANVEDVKFREYRISIQEEHNGSPAVARLNCTESHENAGASFVFTYQRIEYENGHSHVNCGLVDEDYAFGSSGYFSDETGVTDGSCSAIVQGIGTWSFSVAGTTVSASATSGSQSGWNVSLASCVSD